MSDPAYAALIEVGPTPEAAAAAAAWADALPGRAALLARELADRMRDVDPTIPEDAVRAVLAEVLLELDAVATGRPVDEDAIDVHRAALRSLAPIELGLPPAGEPDPAEAPEPSPDRPAADRPSAEVIAVFQNEARELLATCETALLTLEADPGDAGPLHEMFRALHSFKGNCGFMGFSRLEQLSHRAESLMVLLKEGRRAIDDDAVSALIYVVDALADALGDPSDDPQVAGLPELLRNLDRLIGADGEPVAPAPVDWVDDPAPDAAEPGPIGAPAPVPEGDPAEASPAPAESEEPPPLEAALPEVLPAAEAEPAAAREQGLSATPTPAVDAPAPRPAAPPRPVASPNAPAEPERPRAVLAESSGARTPETTLRVDVAKIETLLDLMGELIIAQTAVRHLQVTGPEAEAFARASAQLDRVVRGLQDVSLSLRMVPVGPTFRKMVRVCRDVSQRVGKPVELVLDGEETEIDKTVAEQMADPLVHLVRNAIDHGIETPEARAAAGKPRVGQIRLSGAQVGGEVWIRVEDDGRGLDRAKILARAVDRGLVSAEAGAALPDSDVFAFVFEPGFSTAERVTDVSGRGVGMDVVAKNLQLVKGRVDIRSTPGQGASFTLRIPLTLAIIEGMLMRVGRDSFTVPLLNIRESVVCRDKDVTVLSSGQELVRIRGELLPVVRIHRLFGLQPEHEALSAGILLVVEDGGHPVCLFVDQLVGQRQTVIKAVSGYLGQIRGIAGCTVLGDGRISLVLDVGALVQRTHAAA